MSIEEDPDVFGLHDEPGWFGSFTRKTAFGALPSGSRVRKVKSENGDANPNGTQGTILGSISVEELQNGALLYFVAWDTAPRTAVAVMHFKIARQS